MSFGDFEFLKDLGFVECDLELEKSLQKSIQLNLMQDPDPSFSLDMIPMPQPHVDILSDQEAWQRLPAGATGAGQPLPSWARMLAGDLPRTTAALLELDLAQRTASSIPAGLRAAMRWVAADTNRCAYSLAYAEADAIRSGVHPDRLLNLRQDGLPNWSQADRAALQFARTMSADSDSVTDDEFAALVQFHGERQAASMVLLMAYANFQDRLLLCLGATLENAGPMPPLAVKFPANAFVAQTTPPPPKTNPASAETDATCSSRNREISELATIEQPRSLTTSATGKPLADDPDWAAGSYDVLQQRLEAQRGKPTRLRVPEWDDIVAGLPEGMHLHGDIIWYQIVFGYAPELAVPFELVMRTAGSEGNQVWDRIFGQSLFWVTTKAVKCPYCMGHCEMNFEVAGLKPDEIASRTRLLGSDDWSSFSAAEQQAFAFARKLSKTPWEVSQEDVHQLQQNFGPHLAMLVMLNASRYHYMTRISNGFQLTLERTNVFYDYWRVPPRS